MKVEFKALIDLLTKDRNRIDAAIAALMALKAMDDRTTAPKVAPVRAKKNRVRLTDAQKSDVLTRLSRGERVNDIAKTLSLSTNAIHMLRHRTKNHDDSQPSTNATAIGIQ